MSTLALSDSDQTAVRSLLVLESLADGPSPEAVALLRGLFPGDRVDVSTGSSPTPRGGSAQPGATARLVVQVHRCERDFVTLSLERRGRRFTPRDEALLALVAPILERLLRSSDEPGAMRRPLPDTLTAQEGRVLRLVAQGLSNPEIADRLCLAPSTVRKHLEHAYPKLGVTSRFGAIAALRGDARSA